MSRSTTPRHWLQRLQQASKPAYMLIADLIAEDIHRGVLSARDPLPTLRDLARDLGLNYTTAARGYAEARKRGLVDAHVGIGTVVRGRNPGLPLRAGTSAAMTMNLPPEPEDPALLQRMQAAAAQVMEGSRPASLYDLLRYQDFGGTPADREAGALWLRGHLPGCTPAQVLVAPGVHGTLLALMSLLARPGETVCVESLTYPGTKAMASQLGVRLHPLPMDDEGLLPEAFEHACKVFYPRALVCTPTIQNPTTTTMSAGRREAIADVALRYGVPIVEDDAYGHLPAETLPPLAHYAPELTYYLGGLSKSLGAGLRVSYARAPQPALAERLAGALRATAVMASPLAAAVATRWIQDGLAQQMLEAVRAESVARQALARRFLRDQEIWAHPEGFHVWVLLPEHPDVAGLAAGLRARGVPGVASVAFSTDGDPPPALRLCLGGQVTRGEVESALRHTAFALDHPEPVHERSV